MADSLNAVNLTLPGSAARPVDDPAKIKKAATALRGAPNRSDDEIDA